MEEFILSLASKYPGIAIALMCMAIFRIIFKPIMSILENVAASTPSPKDNLALDSFEKGFIYKALVWIADFALSIKAEKFLK